MPFTHLLAPGRIGSLELRNRILMCPMGDELSNDDRGYLILALYDHNRFTEAIEQFRALGERADGAPWQRFEDPKGLDGRFARPSHDATLYMSSYMSTTPNVAYPQAGLVFGCGAAGCWQVASRLRIGSFAMTAAAACRRLP